MLIRDVMTDEVDLIHPNTTIDEVSRVMRDEDVGILPAADGDRLVGMVTDRDIVVRAVADGKDVASTPVRDAMSEHVLYCFQDQSSDEVAANMGENQIRRLPVLNREKRLVGIVSLGDLSTRGAGDAAGEALEDISETTQ